MALARALIVEPETLLLDEPLSNLDANLREEMRFEVRRLHDAYRYTTVYVTHDQSEAMTTADVICVMNLGKIEQAGSPEEIYDRPRSEFVARFIGMSNVFKGKALDDNRVSFAGVPLRVTGDPLQPNGETAVSIRQHQIELSGEGARGQGQRGSGKVMRQVFLGIEPRLYGRGRGRHAAAYRHRGDDSIRAGRRGVAAAAAGTLPGAGRISRTRHPEYKEETMARRFSRRDRAEGVERAGARASDGVRARRAPPADRRSRRS